MRAVKLLCSALVVLAEDERRVRRNDRWVPAFAVGEVGDVEAALRLHLY